MTTPNIDTELYLPKTYLFERKGQAYSDLAYMTRQGSDLDYVYLPKGLSSVTVTSTGLYAGRTQVQLFNSDGHMSDLTDFNKVTAMTQRLWMGQVSNHAEHSSGLRLKVQAQYITSAGMNHGSVAVQIINFPPEN